MDYIKELIIDGHLRAGERVPQDELASALDVSNTPVREALIALEHEGIVTIEPHRGAFVNPISEASVRDQYELYALLWGWGIERTVARITSEDAAEIAALSTRIAKARSADDMHRLMTEFSERVQRVVGSVSWHRLLVLLPGLIPRTVYYQVVRGAMKAVASWIQEVADGIEAGDTERAVRAIEELMTAQGEALIAELSRRRILAPA